MGTDHSLAAKCLHGIKKLSQTLDHSDHKRVITAKKPASMGDEEGKEERRRWRWRRSRRESLRVKLRGKTQISERKNIIS